MKKVSALLVLLAIALLVYAAPVLERLYNISADDKLRVLIVYNKANLDVSPGVLDAYKSMLEEEGVPHEALDVFDLVNIKAKDLSERIPALIFPDAVLQVAPSEFIEWTKEYMAGGGNIAVVYDAGTKHRQGYFLKKAVFADMVGLNYINFDALKHDAFSQAKIDFVSEQARDFFQVPYGKTMDGRIISGYSFGALDHAVMVNTPLRALPEKDIYAYAVNPDMRIPAIVVTDYENGKAMYVNIALGQLKAEGDELAMRAFLRTFLFDITGLPHIMNVPRAKGGVVLNWHIDSGLEHDNLPYLMDEGIFNEDFHASFHITAGDFRDMPGDNLGFYADTIGQDLVKRLMERGVVGSHGGWAHNWFAQQIVDKKFTKDDIKEYIVKNNEALEKTTGYKIREYSAPVGVHPQPTLTRMLEDMGFVAYYYTGDSGSAPNRTFFNGKMVSGKIISFPVMPFGKAASLWEMDDRYYKTPQEVEKWLNSILDYAKDHRAVRLMYSHPLDVNYFEQEVVGFVRRAGQMQEKGEVILGAMSYFADFLLRFLKTEYNFTLSGDSLTVTVKNPGGLKDTAIALPKNKYNRPLFSAGDKVSIEEDGGYYYVIIDDDTKEKSFQAGVKR